MASDPSNGYEAAAPEFIRLREQSSIGVATVRAWARSLRRGGAILDLGCGAGVPISEALTNEGFVVYGIDASPTLAAAFSRRFAHAHLACEAIEHSRFFDRTFDGVIAVGLMFLLPADVQRATIHKVGMALNAGGRFLFTSPAQKCTWTDVLTGRQSSSLRAEEYKAVFSGAGFTSIREHEDEGENHYYDACLSPSSVDEADGFGMDPITPGVKVVTPDNLLHLTASRHLARDCQRIVNAEVAARSAAVEEYARLGHAAAAARLRAELAVVERYVTTSERLQPAVALMSNVRQSEHDHNPRSYRS